MGDPVEMFWYQNQGSSIWGSRDINLILLSDLGRDIRKMTKKNFFGVFRNQGVMKRGEMQNNFSIFGPIAILSVLNVKVILYEFLAVF